MKVSFDKDFSKTDLKNIIMCGIYDILIYEKTYHHIQQHQPIQSIR
jgi:hypothetical protein